MTKYNYIYLKKKITIKKEIVDLIGRKKIIYLFRRENDSLNKYICLLHILVGE